MAMLKVVVEMLQYLHFLQGLHGNLSLFCQQLMK